MSDLAFSQLKDIISLQTKLLEGDPIYLLTDTSDYGIGGYLYQLIDNVEKPIAFISKSQTESQLHWPTNQKEIYSIIYSIRQLEYLLRDRFFHLLTDHKNLTFVNDIVNAMVIHWKVALMRYDFDVTKISGVKKIVADLLNR